MVSTSLRRLRRMHGHVAVAHWQAASTCVVRAEVDLPEAEQSLTDQQRDWCISQIDTAGYCVLPVKLPAEIVARANEYIDDYCSEPARYAAGFSGYTPGDPCLTGGGTFTETNIVERAAVFREILSYKPALQLAYDMFGPLFRLGQDKWTRKFKPADNPLGPDARGQEIGWHSDGPIGFPELGQQVACHTLRFGYFMSDTLHEGSGTVENMRGSHKSMHNAYAQESRRFIPITKNPAVQSKEVLTAGVCTILCSRNSMQHIISAVLCLLSHV
eukprot:SAG31_NODE_4269_length_3392_cov_1.946250_3_plen_272_part_00